MVKMALGFTNQLPFHLKFEAEGSEGTITPSHNSILKIQPQDRLSLGSIPRNGG